MKKRNYSVTVSSYSYTTEAKSAQNACRKAFKWFISNGLIKRQPHSSDDGGFQGVVVELLP